MQYKYLFGPIPSRRLGLSLGVDMVPKKICSLDCVYCEVGASTKLTRERKEYILFDKLLGEIDHYMQNGSKPDYITLTGSGEPSLNTRLGDTIHYIKKHYPAVKIAILTNGTLMDDPQVRMEMLEADLVMPSLDAASLDVFEKINKPAEGVDLEGYIQGLRDFRQEYRGNYQLEILFLKGYNIEKAELLKLKAIIQSIQPDLIQLNTLDRPGVVENLEALSYEELKEIADFWELDHVNIAKKPSEKKAEAIQTQDLKKSIFQTLKRRPLTIDDLSKMLGLAAEPILTALQQLQDEGKIIAKEEGRGAFYQSK